MNKDLNTILINLTGKFNVDSIIKKYKGLDVAFKDERVVIYDIQSYVQMKKINNSKWCIVRDKDFFNEYYKKGLTKQYVIFDTSKSVVDPLHMIGITINPYGTINACHDYNDNDLKSGIKEMDIYVLYNHYLKPENDNTVNAYIDKHIKYDVYNIFKYGLVDYFIKSVDSGHINPSDDDNYAIRWAASNGYLDVVKYLLSLPKEYGIDPSADYNFAIRLAAENGHLDVVKYLMSLPNKYGIDPSAGDNYAITWAAINGHLDVVKYLLSLSKKYGIDPSADDNYAIRWAAYNGYLDVVEYLMSLPKVHGIDPSARDNHAIQLAASNGHLEVIKYLISLPKEYGIDPSADDNYAIREAANGGHLDVVKYLLSLDRVRSTLSKNEYQYYIDKIKNK